MRDREAFLSAILAHPDDDLPRLIFADWLDEHGEPDRAEFIRLQCAADRGEPDARTAAAREREHALESAHRAEWLAPLGPPVYHAEFRRGFVEHVILPADAFLRRGPALRRRTPLRGVTLLGARRVFRELLDGPLLSGLTALHLTGAHLGDDGVRLLALSPALEGLTALRLGMNDVADGGASALARSPVLHALTTLVLSDNLIGDYGAWELAHSPVLARLAVLDVSGNEIGMPSVRALQTSPRLPALRDLNFADQRRPAGRWLRLPPAPVAVK